MLVGQDETELIGVERARGRGDGWHLFCIVHRLLDAFRADNVGSFLRPAYLLAARRQRVPADELRQIEDRAIADVLRMQEQVGLAVVTDGEFRRKLFFSTVVEVVDGFDPEGFERFHRDKSGNVERLVCRPP